MRDSVHAAPRHAAATASASVRPKISFVSIQASEAEPQQRALAPFPSAMEFHASLQSRRGEESWTSRRSSSFSSWFPTSSSSGLHLALFPRSRRMVVSWLAVFGVRPEEGPIQQRSKGAQTVTDNSTIARAARSASADHSTIPWASTRTKLPAAIASAKTSRCRLVKAMAGDGKHGILNR